METAWLPSLDEYTRRVPSHLSHGSLGIDSSSNVIIHNITSTSVPTSAFQNDSQCHLVARHGQVDVGLATSQTTTSRGCHFGMGTVFTQSWSSRTSLDDAHFFQGIALVLAKQASVLFATRIASQPNLGILGSSLDGWLAPSRTLVCQDWTNHFQSRRHCTRPMGTAIGTVARSSTSTTG